MSIASVKPTKETYPEKLRRQRTELLDAAVSYVRTGKDGTMRDRLRMASEMSGISLNAIESAVGEIDRLKVNVERKKS